ncbi:DUF397 domain-containing protein [Streptomyces sp. NBC_00391]|uniref:DUF397 domain-containing protein n=1 Tax=Streptomyces sp. NBC_00391 TaxID=2903647 RepID=UPI002E23EE32
MSEPSDDGRFVWFTSSYSNGAGGECVKCAIAGDRALVRDSKNAGGPVVTVRIGTWRSFVRALAGKEPGLTWRAPHFTDEACARRDTPMRPVAGSPRPGT